MARCKAHEVDRYLAKPAPDHPVILIYGPDKGLVSERAQRLGEQSGADISDPFATIKLDAEEAASDQNRIVDEAHTVSMFGGKRLVWIRGQTQKRLEKAIQPVLDQPPTDTLVIVEAGDLKPTSPLRKIVEASPAGMALPCYQDQAAALDSIINEETKAHNLTIDGDTRDLLKSLLGGDRLASRSEVQKLCLYAKSKGGITAEDVSDIVGDASALAIDEVVDAASTGNIDGLEKRFKRLTAAGTPVFQIIGAMQRHFQMLHRARAGMEQDRQNAASMVQQMRPPVNFKRKDAVTRALSIWNFDALTKSLARLEKTGLETRANAALAVSLASTTLLAIALEAQQAARRR